MRAPRCFGPRSLFVQGEDVVSSSHSHGKGLAEAAGQPSPEPFSHSVAANLNLRGDVLQAIATDQRLHGDTLQSWKTGSVFRGMSGLELSIGPARMLRLLFCTHHVILRLGFPCLGYM